MEIEPEKLKEFLLYIHQKFREMEQNLLANKAVLSVAEKWGKFDAGLIPSMVERARNSEWMAEHLRERYDEPLARFSQQFDLEVVNRALIEFLKAWEPKDAPPQ